MTTKPTPEEITVTLHRAMDAATGLSMDDISNVQSFIDAGEWELAFEILCTQIYEWDVALKSSVIRELEHLGSALGTAPEYTDCLWEDAVEG